MIRLFSWVVLMLAAALPRAGAATHAEKPLSTVYAQGPDGGLVLQIWRAERPATHGPALVLFHGGGWTRGRPVQFAPMCALLASHGVTCASAQYTLNGGMVVIAEAKAAIAWMRLHSAPLAVDPHEIAAGGGSVGGYLAASTQLISGGSEQTSAPDALVLLNPVLGPLGDGPSKVLITEMKGPLPPTLIVHGSADPIVPISKVRAFVRAARALGSPRVELVVFPGRGHGFWNYAHGRNPAFTTVTKRILAFLKSIFDYSDPGTATTK